MMRDEWLNELASIPDGEAPTFIEIYPENYAARGPRLLSHVAQLAERFPLTAHTVQLSLGSEWRPPAETFHALRAFLDMHDVAWLGDHVAVSFDGEPGSPGENLHELLPIPFDAESARIVARNVRDARELLGREVLVENTCAYFMPPGSDWTESTLMSAIITRGGGSLLLDVNNLWVNAQNLDVDVHDALAALPLKQVREIHVGGFTVDTQSGLLVDSHAAAPSNPVWRLLRAALALTGPKPMLIEWESKGTFADALAQLELARQVSRSLAGSR